MLSVVGAALACAVSVVATATAATSAAAVVPFERACAAAPAGQFSCLARVAPALAPPTGLGAVPYAPVSIKAAYGMNTSPFAGAGQTIAIVDAFDNDRVVSDLAAFDNHYGLPLCNKPNGCFNKVNQNGGTGSFPPPNKGWAQEIALDVEWAHAIAPGAKILLVEAKSAFESDLMHAEDWAVAHANYVSNSWGGGEGLFSTGDDVHFARPGVSVFASAGDSGLGAQYPSTSPNVISVGGTSLAVDGAGHVTSETGWTYGGGGCSFYEKATAAQASFPQYGAAGCRPGMRATPDVSLDADPNTGVGVFDNGNWYQFGGTSVSAPIMAARAATLGGVYDSNRVYHGTFAFRDITSGSNGKPCVAGYDLCTGRGSQLG